MRTETETLSHIVMELKFRCLHIFCFRPTSICICICFCFCFYFYCHCHCHTDCCASATQKWSSPTSKRGWRGSARRGARQRVSSSLLEGFGAPVFRAGQHGCRGDGRYTISISISRSKYLWHGPGPALVCVDVCWWWYFRG